MLAARQHNLVTTRQMHGLGFDNAGIRRRAGAARLHRIHHGVYAVGTPNLTREGWYLAAVLAAGADAVLSHASAAALWRIAKAPLSPVHVTAPTRNGRKTRPGIQIHRPSGPLEHTTLRGIAITSPGRTLMDLAEHAAPREIERALDEARFLHLLHQPSLQRLFRDHPRRSARLRAALARHEPGTTRTRSTPEERFLAWLRRRRLPQPLLNQRVEGYEVDALYPDHGLIIEIDTFHTHGDYGSYRRDRARDRRLAAAGFRVMRLDEEDYTRETAGELRRSLARRAGVSSSIVAKKPPTSSIR